MNKLAIPDPFRQWFEKKGWTPYSYQWEAWRAGLNGHLLLVAPTGGGKTLAGFLPSLEELHGNLSPGLHTLYVSPLKALASDVQRNVIRPIKEMDLRVRCEVRTGDTPTAQRNRQRSNPPHFLLTTPESLALLLSYPEARQFFSSLQRVIVDELHAIANSKRGDLLALNLARLRTLCPQHRVTGLTATTSSPEALARFIGGADEAEVRIVQTSAEEGKRRCLLQLFQGEGRLPWAGHTGRYAIPELYAVFCSRRCSLIFVNTRSQAELIYQELQRCNCDNLPMALHHGSLSKAERQAAEVMATNGDLRVLVATSSLDLGIDWETIDLVVQIGAPKGVARLAQRVGRSGHSLHKIGEAILVPTNRLEWIEAEAAKAAMERGEMDNSYHREGAWDVLAQHIGTVACSEPLKPEDLYREVSRALPYRKLTQKAFDRIFQFVASGGYALGGYEQFRKLVQDESGHYKMASPSHIKRQRLNIGTIVGLPTLQVQFKTGKFLGEVEEFFVAGLKKGETFLFGGKVVRFEGIRQQKAIVSRANTRQPQIPSYAGGRLPLSLMLARDVRRLLADRKAWRRFPAAIQQWLRAQEELSIIPEANSVLAESFPRGGREYLTLHSFAGRNAHQTLGLLMSRRMESFGFQPLGFVVNDYGLAIWTLRSLQTVDQLRELLSPKIMEEEFAAWVDDSFLLKRTFREVAIIAGLIDRGYPGRERSRKQVTFSSDLIYEVLRKYEASHFLLQTTRSEASRELTGNEHLADLLKKINDALCFRRLERVSPLSIPLLLEVGKEGVQGEAIDVLLNEEGDGLMAESLESSVRPNLSRKRRVQS